MSLNFVSADQRLANHSGIKGIIFGPAKIGKTSLLWTLDPASTLALDLEAGMLSVQGWPGASIEIKTWQDAQNIACLLGGPNPALRSEQTYSQAHYDHLCQSYPDPQQMFAAYQTIFIDSITVAGRLCMQWAQGQPEAISEKSGKQDLRAVYGLLGREMVAWLTQLQHTKGKNVWFVGLLDQEKDDFGRLSWQPQMDGKATANALPGIVDQVVSMVELTADDGQPYRAFICGRPNSWGFPAGDRSGKLDMVEEPHLGRLMEKIKTAQPKRNFGYSLEQPPTPQAQPLQTPTEDTPF